MPEDDNKEVLEKEDEKALNDKEDVKENTNNEVKNNEENIDYVQRIKKLEAELQKEKERKALEDENLKKLSEDAFKTLLSNLRKSELLKLNLSEEYEDLIYGNSRDEIEKSALIVKQLIESERSKASEQIKKELIIGSKPAVSAAKGSDALSEEEFYREILK